MEIFTNSFICIFLPASIIFYYSLTKLFKSKTLGKVWVILCSLGFYFYVANSNIVYLLLSFLFNYLASILIIKRSAKASKRVYWVAVVTNILLWIFLKYKLDLNDAYCFIFASNNSIAQWIIPLGFGFITIQQITFLTECYKNEIHSIPFIEYLHFSSFFPKLIAGPISTFKLFSSTQNDNYSFNYKSISLGIYVFFIGLFQKVLLADTFLSIANRGISSPSLNFVQAWVTTLCNTFGIYFSISGYTAMAIGIGYCFNIALPFNFRYPFRAVNINDFWSRWHITFTDFFIKSPLFPISETKQKEFSFAFTIIPAFLLMAVWHKFGFSIFVWGLLQAFALIVFSQFNKLSFSLPKWLAWLITFGFVNVSWIFFRTDNIKQAFMVIAGLLNVKGIFIYYNEFYILWGIGANFIIVLLLLASLYCVLKMKNIQDISESYYPSYKILMATIAMIICSIICNNVTPFLYYGF